MSQTTGILFPLVLTSGKHTLASESELIIASIKTIISWQLYTRFFNDYFGSRSYEVLEEPNDNILVKLIRRFIIDSIGRWEKRIVLQDVEIYRPSQEKLTVELTYTIRSSNISDIFTYTFYTN